MKKILAGMLVGAFCLGVGFVATSKSSGSRLINWSPSHSRKRVKINFSKHKKKGVKCNSCHIRHSSGKRHMKKCKSCHGTKAKAMKAGHKLCRTCHKSKGGPTKCGGCHKH